jgi:flagellar FliL protein
MAGKPEGKPEEAAAAAPAAAASGGGGIKAWLPLLANIILIPAVGYFTITMLNSKSQHTETAAEGAPAAGEHAAKSEKSEKGKGEGKGGAADSEPVVVQLSERSIANPRGTRGSRLIVAKIAVEGVGAKFKELVDKKDLALRDAANNILESKSVEDIDKPGGKNLIRRELLASFNKILGEGAVKDVYLVEFAMQ